MATLSFRDVHKVYPEGTRAVQGIDLEIADGELVVLLGPSGCGKSTMLRLLAGLESPTRGQILVDGRRVDGLPAGRRDVAMIFQSYALYPHKTVRQNLDFPLKMRRTPKSLREQRVREVAELLDLVPLLKKRPGQLSGGQQQRVAIGRALVREPVAFLMDEPLSNLDAQLRTRIRAELAALQRRLAITTLFVTHDQTEAMTLGHRIAVLRDGRLQQIGTPDDLYGRPANVFVAGFVGQPGMNLLVGSSAGAEDVRSIRLGAREISLHPLAKGTPPSDRFYVGWRPESLALRDRDDPRILSAGTILSVESLGPERLVHVQTDLTASGTSVTDREPSTVVVVVRVSSSSSTPRVDDRVGIGGQPEDAYVFDADGRLLDGPTRSAQE